MGSKVFVACIGVLVVLTVSGVLVYRDNEDGRRISEEYATAKRVSQQTMVMDQKKADAELVKLQRQYEQGETANNSPSAPGRLPAGQ